MGIETVARSMVTSGVVGRTDIAIDVEQEAAAHREAAREEGGVAPRIGLWEALMSVLRGEGSKKPVDGKKTDAEPAPQTPAKPAVEGRRFAPTVEGVWPIVPKE